uniref:ENTH domain-containing protein n=1 Tax=Mola mola TaxID=94237 RepID=A0A3Q3WQG0_MOLML
MQSSSLRRQMKNMVNNYTEAEIKVREATSNDPWGPPSSLMSEIADLTFNVVAFTEVIGMIWKRLNDHGKNWRHVYKALILLDYLIKTGSERVAQECRENIYSIQTLRDFQYVDRDGRDQGVNVREKAKNLVALLRDEEKLKKERSQAMKTKTRVSGVTGGLGSGSTPPPYPGRQTSQPRYHGDESDTSSSSSPQVAPDLEQARPATSGEEELQLQLALAMSREESEKTAFMDLVDVFAVPTDQPPTDHRWNAPLQASAHLGGTDPWDSLGEPIVNLSLPKHGCLSTRLNIACSKALPSLLLKKAAPTPRGMFSLCVCDPDSCIARTQSFSLVDGYLFDEAMDGGQVTENGRGESSPELFDLSCLGESLAAHSPRKCRTPEAFLSPAAASLVNLDRLIPGNPSARTTNPFLSGLSAPSAANPFQDETPKLTLNQLGPASSATHSFPYSASLPLPVSQQPVSLPSSLTHPTQPGLDLPGSLPEPLLPSSSVSTDGSQAAQDNQNPFL